MARSSGTRSSTARSARRRRVSPGAIFVVDRSGGLTALSADAQQVLWHFDAGAAINATPLLADGKLFFGASNGIFYAIDVNDGRALARIQLGGSIETSPTLEQRPDLCARRSGVCAGVVRWYGKRYDDADDKVTR